MTHDQTSSAVEDLASRGVRRGADAVLTAAREHADHPDYAAFAAPAQSRRSLQLVAGLLVAGTVALALISAGILPGQSTLSRAVNSIVGTAKPDSETTSGYLTNELGEELISEHVAHVDEWLAGYDQDELRHVDPTAGRGQDLATRTALVESMDFRQACRSTNDALQAAKAVDDAERASLVSEMMDPVVARLRDRQMFRGSGMPRFFELQAEHLHTADFTFVQLSLDRNCNDAISGGW